MANAYRTDIHESFFQLVKSGIGTGKAHNGSCFLNEPSGRAERKNPGSIGWAQLKEIADRQGLSAIVLDALNTNSAILTDTMPLQMKLEWIGEVLQNFEQRYALYEKAIGTLAGFYNQQGFKMMVLKGYTCSLDWPKPNHRPCGDIDIWQFGKQKAADAALSSEKGVKIDSSHHHHTVFEWQGFTVENHYDFINIHHHKSHAKFEKILKELGQDDSHSIEVNGEKVYLPSPNLHALFLIKHLMLHFSTGEITLRQLLDWGLFVEKHWKDIDWDKLESTLQQFSMKDLYNVFNAICVRDLGFDVKIFRHVQFDPKLKDRVLKDILSPEFGSEVPSGLFKRIVWKWRRWKANGWKHRLCYEESMWSAFWSGVWNHLLKPSSI